MQHTNLDTARFGAIDAASHNAPEFALPDRLEDASFYTDTPFPIFEFDNFLPPEFYSALVADVQGRATFDRVFAGKGNKKKLSLTGKTFDTFEASPFKSLAARLMSDGVFDWFARTHLPHYGTTAEPVLVRDKSVIDLDALRRADSDAGIDRAYFDVELHYSSIGQGGFIPPHTDDPKKRMSLVLYLPSEDLPEDMQINCGTVFYASKRRHAPNWDRFESGLLNEKQTEKFHAKHEVVHISRFVPNRCIGFIKSGISWHAVAPIKADYDRRAIVMNIHEL
jgi:hypothetical protein